MGRGRQRAKQRRNARKLKYLTTDTDYAELQRELSGQGADDSSADQDPLGQIDEKFQHEREMDEYAKWAAESAAKAKKQVSQTARPRKPIPSGLFAAMLKSSHDDTQSDESKKGDKNDTAAKSTVSQPVATTKEKPAKKSAQSAKASTSRVKSTAKKSTTRTASARKATTKTATRKATTRTAAAQKSPTRKTTARKKTTRTTTARTVAARAKKAKTSKTSSTRSTKSAA